MLNNLLILFQSKEIVQLKTKVNESDALTESVREYAKKLEKHYKAKKEEHTDTQNKLSEKISLLAVENRTLREENVFFKEKINTMKFENEQLTIQKDSVQKKLLQDESLAFSYQHVSKNLGSTPRDSSKCKHFNKKNISQGVIFEKTLSTSTNSNQNFNLNLNVEIFLKTSVKNY